MNLLLLEPQDILEPGYARISGRRFEHMMSVHRVETGSQLRCGVLNDRLGQATVTAIESDQLWVRFELDRAPPPELPVTLVLALPRPKMLKRILETCATMGVKQLILVNAYRVDKSYWSTPILQPEQIHHHFTLGLEQSGDTRLPELQIRKRFKPFVEDELPQLVTGKRALIAHPYEAQPCPPASMDPTLIAIGPEGGFIPYEVELMKQQGLQPIHLGSRILRVETAIPAVLSRLFPLL